MKKILSMVVAIALALLALTSCGQRQKVDISNIKSISELNGTGANIAAQTNTFHLDALRAQVTGVNISDYDSFSLLLNALNSGAIDGYVAEEPTAWSVCAKDSSCDYIKLENNTTGFKATAADVGIAVAFKLGSDKVEKVNAVIAGISEQTREALMRQMVTLSEDVTAVSSDAPALVSSNTDTSNGTLKIAMECDYQPYNWTQLTDVNGAVKIANSAGYANGYDIQMAKYIAAELGMKLEVYAYAWESLIPAVQSGTIDGIIAGMSPTEERQAQVAFTDCYWSSNLVIIIKK